MQVTAVLLAAVLVVGVPAVAFSLPSLLGMPDVLSALEPLTPSTAPATGAVHDDNDGGLSITAVLPRRLVRDVPMRLRLGVDGTDEDSLLAVTLQVEVTADAVGWLQVEPPRLVVGAAGLTHADFRVLGFGRLPCSDTTGTLSVRVEEIAEPAGTGSLEIALPGIPCDVDGPPPAPETVHLLDPVCGDDWRADAAALLDGRRPSDAWCRPTRRPAPDRVREDAREDDEPEEPEEPDEPDEPDQPDQPDQPDEPDEPDDPEPDDDPDQDDPDDDPDQDDPDDDPEAGENGDGGEGGDA